jgi:hypothetical protein
LHYHNLLVLDKVLLDIRKVPVENIAVPDIPALHNILHVIAVLGIPFDIGLVDLDKADLDRAVVLGIQFDIVLAELGLDVLVDIVGGELELVVLHILPPFAYVPIRISGV